ncbi:type VII secretion target [Nocardia sp. alder85J]|nr:type VII secretion target [Nocardia sp. alder85J]
MLKVDPQVFRQYGDIAEGSAGAVAAAGAIDQASTVAAAVPVFGLIGQEFLASFAYAQNNHVTAVTQLANVLAGQAATSRAAADTYERAEQHSTDGFSAL